jgi:parallel beta-helix repeat protein
MHKRNALLIIISSLCLLSIILQTPFGSQFQLQIIRSVKADPKTIIVPTEYETIQEAINAADPGDTILVMAETYHEHVVVNKTVWLKGENRETTIIDGGGTGIVVTVNVDNVNVTGFTIQNGGKTLAGYGVFLYDSTGTTISSNTIRSNGWNGLGLVNGSNNNSIVDNLITANHNQAGIHISSSGNNTIQDNTIENNFIGALVSSSTALNTFHHNNFLNNIYYQASDFAGSKWDNGTEGNFWSDYTGLDDGSNERVAGDGVGDTDIPHYGIDYYPLMSPFGETEPPEADAGRDQTVFQGMTVTLNGNESRDDVGIKSYVWAFTDVTPKVLTGVHVTYRFKNVGNFDVTLNVTDYADKWAIDTMWVNVSADNTEPTISNLSQDPTSPDASEKVTVLVDVTDEQSQVCNVTISYRTNGGPWNNVSMSMVTGDTWEGQIPELPEGTDVQYMIIAYDNAENPAVDDYGGNYYVYVVVPEFPVVIFSLLFVILTLVVVILKKRKKGTFKL